MSPPQAHREPVRVEKVAMVRVSKAMAMGLKEKVVRA
jgi:hypothetical protein